MDIPAKFSEHVKIAHSLALKQVKVRYSWVLKMRAWTLGTHMLTFDLTYLLTDLRDHHSFSHCKTQSIRKASKKAVKALEATALPTTVKIRMSPHC